ncbi:hypothetical protein CLIB1444_07S04302 [[Candida] jaroonii]|uniref:Uncharacterized protein n=1 Tax=[Candida] jaroonii TaxID=467808 RepID=A0ACA9Y9Y7_9ASCO|nr:hypothetical protein CLIB1444_07S04302 [[Candida] jaroonii]
MIANILKYFKSSPEPEPSADDSIIILEEHYGVEEITQDFDSLQVAQLENYQIESKGDEDEEQYGTTFNNAINFKTSNDIKTLRFNSNLLDIDTETYEYKISQFYWPVLNKYQSTKVEVPKSWYDIDDKLKEIDDEISKLKVVVLPPTRDELKQINDLFNRSDNDIIKKQFTIDLSVRDLKTLQNKRWLNDNVIDYYLSLICKNHPEYFCWTTHFFTTLQSKGYDGIKRWGKRKKLNIFEKKLIFIPININSSHWALTIINNDTKTIEYYDSLNLRGNMPVLKTVQSYMIGEKDRLNAQVDINDWQLISKASPQQLNGFDCGVFTCICAKYLSRNLDLSYSQGDMANLRNRMILEILDDELTG